jgi:hypothetical protein
VNHHWKPAGTACGPGAVRAQLPPDRFVVLDGGHCLHRDLPDRWLEKVGGFADAVVG